MAGSTELLLVPVENMSPSMAGLTLLLVPEENMSPSIAGLTELLLMPVENMSHQWWARQSYC
ncbi:hypothetical protein DPMN_004790 [Dreissena polymorpha]|uniref:Uncharacterized protein n=1 Tax=Dreissena polymorpha TaxID=45954 RepID=A0A9D4MQV1_DREPO|nr:hypothetical protein DPMN_004790 [Dreissena polymorpha]